MELDFVGHYNREVQSSWLLQHDMRIDPLAILIHNVIACIINQLASPAGGNMRCIRLQLHCCVFD